MTLPPAVLVQDRASIERALAPGLQVTLLSPPGFAGYAGAPWWQALLRAARFDGPSLLDCGDAPGRALEALRIGLPGVVVAARGDVFAQIVAIARVSGAMALEVAPPALDVRREIEGSRVRDWLARETKLDPARNI